jgi:TP901-1 family phage major tail protein
MGLMKARDVMIKIGDDGAPESFDFIGGLYARTIALSARLVEATTAQSPQAWRELMAGAGIKRIEVVGSGWFWDKACEERMRSAFFSGAAPRFQLDVYGFGLFEGPFAIAELNYGGEHDHPATFSMRLASAGAISFTAE